MMHNQTYRRGRARLLAVALSVMAFGGLTSLPVMAHADPPTGKDKPGKGKGDGGTIPIKVEPPIITKDPKAPAPTPPPKKKDG